MPNAVPVRSLWNAACWLGGALSLVLLTACGGGGGSGGSGSGGGGTISYSVGGTVSGLNQSGLVLTDNDGDNLTVASGATSFTFATKLMSGASYAVAVGTQPTGETCTVSSASGSVSSANVTSVTVTCTGSTYTIGGSVSGLTRSGLVLTDNGGENLTVASGATAFTFATKLSSGASYAVAVGTQPTGETCTVSSGSGPVSSANVTSVTVACTGETYTISGGISGLNTSGLNLQDYPSGETLSVAAAATSFQFVHPVPYDTNVNVTVTAQPTWQTCTAGGSNFSGPITANVTSDTFSCVTDAGIVTSFAGGSSFNGTAGVAMDSSGNIYVADTNDNEILEITSGTVITLAGNGTAGNVNGPGSTAEFSSPNAVAVDSSGNVYVADSTNNEIRKITISGGVATVSTLAGSGGGVFRYPEGVAVDSSGNVYVADSQNDIIRMVTQAGVVTTVAGIPGTPGSTNGSGTSATFNLPKGVTVDSAGNIYVADTGNNEIREINQSDVVSTLAGSTTAGHADGTGSAASFNGPSAVAVDSGGDVYVADSGNDEIRMVTPQGIVTTLAGSTTAGNTNGTGSGASFNSPDGIVVDPSGNLFVGDYLNNEIREVSP